MHAGMMDPLEAAVHIARDHTLQKPIGADGIFAFIILLYFGNCYQCMIPKLLFAEKDPPHVHGSTPKSSTDK
jgi:hypothetical protein